MKIRRSLVLAVTLGAVAFASTRPAPAAPPEGRARAVVRTVDALPAELEDPAATARTPRRFAVPVEIDLKGVVVDGVPAALGAYVVRLEYDPSAVAALSVTGGDAPFADAPVFTTLENANRDGRLGLAGVQVSSDRATGLVRVARVLFAEKEPGGRESVKLRVHSLSTPLMQRSASGATVRAEGAGQAVHAIPVAQ